jgi:hypothetical protein
MRRCVLGASSAKEVATALCVLLLLWIVLCVPIVLATYPVLLLARVIRIGVRKLKHRLLGRKRVRRRSRPNLYPEAAIS